MRFADRSDGSEGSRNTEDDPLLRDTSENKPLKVSSFLRRVRQKCKLKNTPEKPDRTRHRRSRIRRWHVGARRRLRCWFYVQQRWLKIRAARWIAQFTRGMIYNSYSVLDRIFFSRRELQRHFDPSSSKRVPKGFVPVYVGQEHQRFIIPVNYFHHPLFEGFLKAAEKEFGYHQKGVLLIPCNVSNFEEATLQMNDSRMFRRMSLLSG